MLGYTKEAPSSSEISEEEYVPESDESDSDSSVDVKQLKRRKQRAQKTTPASSMEVHSLKRRCVTTSSSLAAKGPGESSSPDVTVIRSLNEAKWNAPQLIPFNEDVRKMHQYLDTKTMECQRNLKEEAVKKNWAELAKITLCEVIIFNRRREGEVSKMPLNAFTLRDTSVTHPDVELALSELEKKLCKHLQQIEI